VTCNPVAASFGPQTGSKQKRGSVVLSYDELEAIRLADYEGFYQERAAVKMNISRQTFGNIISSAHKKVADFLVNSKRMSVEGGTVEVGTCRFVCRTCGYSWSIARGSGKPEECPHCKGKEFCCAKKIGTKKNNQTCWRSQ
jgi:predicted DNA-binding protein (UPF0251 family)